MVYDVADINGNFITTIREGERVDSRKIQMMKQGGYSDAEIANLYGTSVARVSQVSGRGV